MKWVQNGTSCHPEPMPGTLCSSVSASLHPCARTLMPPWGFITVLIPTGACLVTPPSYRVSSVFSACQETHPGTAHPHVFQPYHRSVRPLHPLSWLGPFHCAEPRSACLSPLTSPDPNPSDLVARDATPTLKLVSNFCPSPLQGMSLMLLQLTEQGCNPACYSKDVWSGANSSPSFWGFSFLIC